MAYNSANDDMSDIEIGPQDEDVTYTESSSASGIINSYNAAVPVPEWQGITTLI